MDFNKYTDKNIYLLNGKKDILYKKDIENIKKCPDISNPDIKYYLQNPDYIKIALELNSRLFKHIDFSLEKLIPLREEITLYAFKLDYDNFKYIKNPSTEIIDLYRTNQEDIILNEIRVNPYFYSDIESVNYKHYKIFNSIMVNPSRNMIESCLKLCPRLINNISKIDSVKYSNNLLPSDYIKAYKANDIIFTKETKKYYIPRNIDLFKSLFDISYEFIDVPGLLDSSSSFYEEFYLYVLAKLDSSPGYLRKYYNCIPMNESLLLKYLEQTNDYSKLEYFNLDYVITSKILYELVTKYNFINISREIGDSYLTIFSIYDKSKIKITVASIEIEHLFFEHPELYHKINYYNGLKKSNILKKKIKTKMLEHNPLNIKYVRYPIISWIKSFNKEYIKNLLVPKQKLVNTTNKKSIWKKIVSKLIGIKNV